MAILILDPDVKYAHHVEWLLMDASYQTVVAADEADVLSNVDAGRAELVLLEMHVPSGSGLDICRRIRRSSDVPIIFLTSDGEIESRVAGLTHGADDYLVKPVDPHELLLHISAVLRRALQPQGTPNVLVRGVVTLKAVTNELVLNDHTTLTLTPMECRILYYLMLHAGHVVSRAQIADAVWQEQASDRTLHTVAVYINRLRHKLHADADQPRFIRTVRDLGYLFVGEASGG